MSQAPDPTSAAALDSIETIQDRFRDRDYVCDRSLATAVFLGLKLGRPLLLEGGAGAGKTELARAPPAWLGPRRFRLRCYGGRDANAAVSEGTTPPRIPRTS